MYEEVHRYDLGLVEHRLALWFACTENFAQRNVGDVEVRDVL
jgi:hypothetical protein